MSTNWEQEESLELEEQRQFLWDKIEEAVGNKDVLSLRELTDELYNIDYFTL